LHLPFFHPQPSLSTLKHNFAPLFLNSLNIVLVSSPLLSWFGQRRRNGKGCESIGERPRHSRQGETFWDWELPSQPGFQLCVPPQALRAHRHSNRHGTKEQGGCYHAGSESNNHKVVASRAVRASKLASTGRRLRRVRNGRRIPPGHSSPTAAEGPRRLAVPARGADPLRAFWRLPFGVPNQPGSGPRQTFCSTTGPGCRSPRWSAVCLPRRLGK
jgi:hypothetical protein